MVNDMSLDFAAANSYQTGSSDRSRLGKHYTSEVDILKVLRPLFVDALEERVAECEDVAGLGLIRAELSSLQFFDPAAGCGNFLVVAYRELLLLETVIVKKLGQLGVTCVGSVVSPAQFHGLEYETVPELIVKAAFADLDPGQSAGPHLCYGQDALLCDWAGFLQETGQDGPLYIVGNPPYKGNMTLTLGQKQGLRTVWGKDFSGQLDYSTGWFKKTVDLMVARGSGRITKAGLIVTSSVTQGSQPVPLWSGLQKTAVGVGIDFAYQPFLWKSDEDDPAGVSVVIIGFSINPYRTPDRQLWLRDGLETVTSEGISPYLFDGPDTLFYPVKGNQPSWVRQFPLKFGSMPNDGGHLLITKDELPSVQVDTNAARFIRRFYGAAELIQGRERWCLWLKDSTPADRVGGVIADRIRKVAETRLRSVSVAARTSAATSYLFYADHQSTGRYLAIPGVSSANRDVIPMRHLEPDIIASEALFTITNCPTVLFGVLQSQMFTVWQDTIGGRLKNDRRMSTYVYDTFPFLPLDQLTAVEGPAVTLLEIQERLLASGMTLAQMYQRGNTPADLTAAHVKLDEAVDAAYGLTGTESVRAAARFGTLAAAYQQMVSVGVLL